MCLGDERGGGKHAAQGCSISLSMRPLLLQPPLQWLEGPKASLRAEIAAILSSSGSSGSRVPGKPQGRVIAHPGTGTASRPPLGSGLAAQGDALALPPRPPASAHLPAPCPREKQSWRLFPCFTGCATANAMMENLQKQPHLNTLPPCYLLSCLGSKTSHLLLCSRSKESCRV